MRSCVTHPIHPLLRLPSSSIASACLRISASMRFSPRPLHRCDCRHGIPRHRPGMSHGGRPEGLANEVHGRTLRAPSTPPERRVHQEAFRSSCEFTVASPGGRSPFRFGIDASRLRAHLRMTRFVASRVPSLPSPRAHRRMVGAVGYVKAPDPLSARASADEGGVSVMGSSVPRLRARTGGWIRPLPGRKRVDPSPRAHRRMGLRDVSAPGDACTMVIRCPGSSGDRAPLS